MSKTKFGWIGITYPHGKCILYFIFFLWIRTTERTYKLSYSKFYLDFSVFFHIHTIKAVFAALFCCCHSTFIYKIIVADFFSFLKNGIEQNNMKFGFAECHLPRHHIGFLHVFRDMIIELYTLSLSLF